MPADLRGWARALRPSNRPSWLMMPEWFATPVVDSLLFVLSALEHHGISYVAHKGLLLGALRLRGLLPWDDDSDVFLLDTANEVVQTELGATFEAHGFNLWFRQHEHYFFAFPKTFLPFASSGLTELGLLTRSSAADGIHFDAHEPRRHLREDELFPVRRIPFYGSYVLGPAKADVAMERMYGELAAPPVMDRFRAPGIAAPVADFWRSARPIAGAMDWPRISDRFKTRMGSARFQVGQLQSVAWHFVNRAHWIATDVIRALAGGERGA